MSVSVKFSIISNYKDSGRHFNHCDATDIN